MDFYYPFLVDKKSCCGCKDCVKICPVHAITYENEQFQVYQEKCQQRQESLQDLCMTCLECCRKKVIQLQKGE